MKKNLLAAAAVVFAITLSSFTIRTDYDHYAIYDRTIGLETSYSSYTFDLSEPATDNGTVGNTIVLNWFKIVNTDPSSVSPSEFTAAFNGFDSPTGTVGSLADEAEIAHVLDLKKITL